MRFAAADDIWLSTATVATAGTSPCTNTTGASTSPTSGAVEAIAADVDGRPHWGKLHYRDAASLRGAYPHLDDFVALRTGSTRSGCSATPTCARCSAS